MTAGPVKARTGSASWALKFSSWNSRLEAFEARRRADFHSAKPHRLHRLNLPDFRQTGPKSAGSHPAIGEQAEPSGLLCREGSGGSAPGLARAGIREGHERDQPVLPEIGNLSVPALVHLPVLRPERTASARSLRSGLASRGA